MPKKIPAKEHASKALSTKEYIKVLKEIKTQIEQSQVEAIMAVNVVLNKRNWIIGKIITEKQNEHK